MISRGEGGFAARDGERDRVVGVVVVVVCPEDGCAEIGVIIVLTFGHGGFHPGRKGETAAKRRQPVGVGLTWRLHTQAANARELYRSSSRNRSRAELVQGCTPITATI